MKFAYADPPYLGLCSLYDHDHGDEGLCWDEIDTHRLLIERLCENFDGWALSLHTPSLGTILSICPDDIRVGAWVKPFTSFKPNVGEAFAWEPVIFSLARKRNREQRTVRDWFAHSITLRRGFTGAKPAPVVHWMLDFLNVEPGDEVVDLFHGSGAAADAIDGYLNRPIVEVGTLFGSVA